MKKLSILFICMVLVNLLNAQVGSVLSVKKISNTQGNFTASLDNYDHFGRSVTSIGDLNGDGIGDLACSAFDDDDGGTNKGAVYILFLDTNATVKSYQKISDISGGFTGTLPSGTLFGTYIESIGDLNKDGIIDIAVGAHKDTDGGSETGAVWILFLDTNGTVKSHQKISKLTGYGSGGLPIQSGSWFGIGIAKIGDINNDSIQDIVVGSIFDNDGGYKRGAAWVLLMDTNGSVKNYQKISDTQGNFTATLDNQDYFGHGMSGIGDINNDNIPDVAIGAYCDDDGGTNKGAIYIINLDTNGTVKSYHKISNTSGNLGNVTQIDGYFGSSISIIDDLDGDYQKDLIVGSPRNNGNGSLRGALYVLFMDSAFTVKSYQKISDTHGNFSATLDNGDRFGGSNCVLPDINSDGKPEIAVGVAQDDDGGTDRGAAYILTLQKAYSTTIVANHNQCFGDCNGVAVASVSGGTPPFTYLWSNNSTNDTIFNLCAGTYSVTITDSLLDTISTSITITQPSVTSSTISGITNICYGQSTTLSVSVSGGTSPYYTYWNGLGFGASKTVTPSVTTDYIVDITDANYCTHSDTITVSVTPPPSVYFSGLNNTYCQNSTISLLNGYPSGGTFTGNGISGSNFNPSNAGVGQHTIIYHYSTPAGCFGADTQIVTVNQVPNVSISNLDTAYCNNELPVTLIGSPVGGQLSGNAISGNALFSPSFFTNGGYDTIVYNYTSSNGCSNSLSRIVHVINSPTANAGSDVTITYNTNVTLQGSGSSGSGAFSYSWQPSDSLYYSTIQNPTTLNLKTSNNFELTITDLLTGCIDIDSVFVNIAGQLAGTITSTVDTICTGTTVQLFANATGGNGIFTYQWSSSPSSGTLPAIASIVVSPQVTTTYTVTIGSGTQSITNTKIIFVKPSPSVSISNLQSLVCVNDQAIVLSGTPSGGTFSGNGISGTSFYPSISGVGIANIYYSYQSANGCFGYDTSSIEVKALPSISFNGLSLRYCLNDTPVSLSGNPIGGAFLGGNISGNLFDPMMAGTGSHLISYSYTDSNGCTNSSYVSTNVFPLPFANAGTDTSIVCGVTSSMIGSGSTPGYAYSWLPTSGLNDAFLSKPIASPIVTTQYILEVTNNQTSCSNTDTVMVFVTGGPVAAAWPDTSVCPASGVTVYASGGVSYVWNTAQTTQSIIAYPQNTTYYIVTVYDANGCGDIDTATVTVFPKPIVDLGNDTTLKQSHSITLDPGSGFLNYIWQDNSQNQTFFVNGILFPASLNTFYVEVTDSNTCTNADTIRIDIINDVGIDRVINVFKICPNPVRNYIVIDIEGNQLQESLVEFFNVEGKMVASYQLHGLSGRFNVKQLNPGFYFGRLVFEDGSISTFRFIKE